MTLREVAFGGAVILALAACHHDAATTGPKGIDPSVRLTNQSPDVARIIIASDESGSLIYDTTFVPAGTTVCKTWLQNFDSIYTKIIDTLPNVSGHYSTLELPWLKLGQYAYYFQDDTVFPSGSAIGQHVAQDECTP